MEKKDADARVRIDLAHCRAHIGLCQLKSNPGEAFRELMKAAELLEASGSGTVGADEFNRAIYLALCLPITPPGQRAELTPRLADRVFQAMDAARDKGITDPQYYKSSQEFDPICGDARFEQFMRELPHSKSESGGSPE